MWPMFASALEHFTDLDDVLAVGSYPHAPEHVQQLQACGVQAVVNLQSEEDLSARGVRWPILGQLYTRAGIVVARVPVTDFDRADLQRHLSDAVASVEGFVAQGRKTYVHCNAGMNRSPSAVIAWRVAHRGETVQQATAWLSDHHACAPYPDVLMAWAKRLGLPAQ